MNKHQPHRQTTKQTITKEQLNFSEYTCNCCNLKFYTDGNVEHCPNCGSTSEVTLTRNLTTEVIK